MTERKRAVKNMAGDERFDLEVLMKWIKTEILFENFDSEALQGHAEVPSHFNPSVGHLVPSISHFVPKKSHFVPKVNKARFFRKFEVKECLVCVECSSYKIHTILSIALGYDAKIKTRLLAFLSKPEVCVKPTSDVYPTDFYVYRNDFDS